MTELGTEVWWWTMTVFVVFLAGALTLWDAHKRHKVWQKEVENMYWEAAMLGLTKEALDGMTPNEWKQFRGQAHYWREVQKLAPYALPIDAKGSSGDALKQWLNDSRPETS